MSEQKPSRLRADGDGRTELTPNYLRLHFDGKELLADRPIHPTMWVRGWFPDGWPPGGRRRPRQATRWR
ncbi:MAG: hypothetical protein QOG79_6586 [Mycobacterium sp.]|nr:hypothetical protein [Mycobacterium sp.]